MLNIGNLLRNLARHAAGWWGRRGASLAAGLVLAATEAFAQSGGVLQFSTNNFTVLESDGFASITVVRFGSSNAAVTVQYTTVAGTAVPGTDYIEKSGTLVFGAGDTSKTFSILVLDNTVTNPPKTVRLILALPGNGAVLGNLTNATLTILDNDAVSDTVGFAFNSYQVVENTGPAPIILTRFGARTTTLTVDYTTLPGGTAVTNADYLPTAGRITFFPGQATATFYVTNVHNSIPNQGDRSVFLALTNPLPSNAAFLGTSNATLVIHESDFVASSFLFASSNFATNENAGAATITVTRAGSTVGIATVDFFTSDGTATNLINYFATNGTLLFTNGQRFASFQVRIIRDTLVLPNNTVNLNLTRATGGASIVQSNATLTIIESDSMFHFSTDRYVTNENGVLAIVTVLRDGGVINQATVQMYTYDFGPGPSNAQSGFDYTGIYTNLVFTNGQTFFNVAIPVIDDFQVGNDKVFGVALTNAVGGIIGQFNPAQVVIIETDTGAGVFSFSYLSQTNIVESGGQLFVNVSRRSGFTGAVSVNVFAVPSFAFCPGSITAELGVDYVLSTNTLTWADGDRQDKGFAINIIDDNYVELDEQIQLQLYNPTGGASLSGAGSTMTATIAYDDQPPGAVEWPFNLRGFNNPTPGANNLVYAVAVYTSQFYRGQPVIGGDFTAVDSLPRPGIARLNFDGTVDPTFDPGSGANGSVNAIALQADDKVIVGGGFTSINNVSRNGIARLYPDGTLDNTFDPGSGVDGTVLALLRQADGRIVLGGSFSLVNGVPRNNLARLNADGSVDLNFDPGLGTDAAVWALATQPFAGSTVPIQAFGTGMATNVFNTGTTVGTINLTLIFGAGTNQIGILYGNLQLALGVGTGTTNISFAFGPGNSTQITIFVVPLPGSTAPWSYSGTIVSALGNLIIGGDFTSVNGRPRSHVARLTDSGGLDTTFDPGAGPDNTVYALSAQSDRSVLAGGSFSSFNGLPWHGIARMLPDGATDTTTFNPGVGFVGSIYAMKLQGDGKPVLGGDFTSFNGVPRTNVARLYLDGTLDTGFMDSYYNRAVGLNGFVAALAIYPFAGTYTAAIGNFGGPPNPLGTNFGNVNVPANSVMVGGAFTQGGGGQNIFGVQQQSYFTRLVGGDIRPVFNMPGNVEFVAASFSVSENGGQVAITARRINGSVGTLLVNYTTVDGSAIAGTHYGAISGQLFWDDCDTLDKTIFVPIIDNTIVDGNKTFTLVLENPFSTGVFSIGEPALGFQDATTVLIIDNDFDRGTIGFSAPAYYVLQGSNAVIAVTRTGGSNAAVSVHYATANGTAFTPGDYTPVSGNLFFGSGDTVKTFTVPTKSDATPGPEKYLFLTLSNPSVGAQLRNGATNAALVIMDTNPGGPGSLSFSTNAYSVGEGDGQAIITVRRTSGTAGAVSIGFYTANIISNGWGYPNVDYISTNGLLTFLAGETVKTFTVPIIDDLLVEGPETVLVVLTNASTGATIGYQSNALLTIIDNDSYGKLGFASASYFVNEAAGSITLPVTRTEGMADQVSVDYTVVPGTARSGVDYVATNGTLTFLTGETTQNIVVPILSDNTVSPLKFFTVILTNFAKAAPALFTNATVGILDQETLNAPAGTLNTSFAPALNGPVDAIAIQDDFKMIIGGRFTAVNLIGRNRIARLNADGSLDTRFNPGLGANGPVNAVAVQGDRRILIGGGFTVVGLTNRAHIARLTIDGLVDSSFNPGSGADNPVYAVAVNPLDGRIVIGGAFVNFNGTLRPHLAQLQANGALDPSFNTGSGPNGPVYAVAIQGDGKVILGGDFTTVNGADYCYHIARLNSNGTLDTNFVLQSSFDGTVRALTLQPDGKILVGGAFTVANGAPRKYLARLNTDGSLDAGFLAAPNAGANDFVYALLLQPDGKIVVGGNFTSFNSVARNRLTRLTTTGATDPKINFGLGADDYVAALALQHDNEIVVGGGFVTFDGQPRPYLAQVIGGDTDGTGVLAFSSPNYTVLETGANAAITVRRFGGTSGSVSATFATSDGTGSAGVDYSSVTVPVNFADGEDFQTVLVPVLHDTLAFDDRTVDLALSNPSVPGALGDLANATLTIVNVDCVVGFAADSFTVNENVPGGFATIVLVRSGAVNSAITVNYATVSGGTATPYLDYLPVAGTLSFATGEVTKIFALPVTNNLITEGDQTVQLQLSSPSAPATLGQASATLTIVDANLGPGVLSFSAPVYMTREDAGFATIMVTRSGGNAGVVTVQYATSNNTAVAGTDYLATAGTLTFAEGETNRSFFVPILGDSAQNPSRELKLFLFNPTAGAKLGSPSVAALVINDVQTPAGSVDTAFNPLFGADASVFALAYTPSNALYVGGDFTSFYGFNAGRIVRLNPDNTVDPTFNPGAGANAAVYALAPMTNGTVMVGGDFTSYQTQAFNRIVLLDNAGRPAPAFNPPSGANAAVYALGYATLPVISFFGFPPPQVSNTNIVQLPANSGVLSLTFTFTGSTNQITNTFEILYDNFPIYQTVVPVGSNSVSGSTSVTFGPGLGTSITIVVNGGLTNGGSPWFYSGQVVAGSEADRPIYAGGAFTHMNGASQNRISRLNANGTLDATFNVGGTGADNTIYALAVTTNGQVYIGGDFMNVNGASRPRIARLNANGSVDAFFAPGLGADATVRAIALQDDGKIIIGGDFLSVNGVFRSHVARLNQDGSVDLTFDPLAGPDDIIRALDIDQTGLILIAGDFLTVDGVPLGHIARLNADGSIDPFFDAGTGANDRIYALALTKSSNPLLLSKTSFAAGKKSVRPRIIGGRPTLINLYPYQVALLRAPYDPTDVFNNQFCGGSIISDQWILTAAHCTINESPSTMVVGVGITDLMNPVNARFFSVDKIYVHPGYNPVTFVNDISLIHLAQPIDFGGGYAAQPIRLATPAEVAAGMTAPGVPATITGWGDTVGGSFPNYPNILQVATLPIVDPAATLYLPGMITPGMIVAGSLQGNPETCHGDSGGPLVVTNFITRQIFQAGIVSFGIANCIDPGYPSVFTRVSAYLSWISQQVAGFTALNNRIAIGGDFTSVNNQPRHHFAVLNGTGVLQDTVDASVVENTTVYSITCYTNVSQLSLIGRLLVGGEFAALQAIGHQNRVARLLSDGTPDLTFNPGSGADATIRTIALQANGQALVGGFFTNFNRIPRNYLARLNIDGSLDPTYNAGAGLNNRVLAIEVQNDGRAVVGGSFTAAGGKARKFIARLNPDGTVDTGFDPGLGPNAQVRAIAIQSDGRILIGGDFTSIDGSGCFHIARLFADGSLDTTFDLSAGPAGPVNAIRIQSDGRILAGGAFTNVAGMSYGNLVRLFDNGQVDPTFNFGSGPVAGADAYVSSIAIQPGGQILVAGGFTTFNGLPRNRLARLNSDGSTDVTINFGTGADNFINVVKVQDFDGNILIGGGFTQFNGEPHLGIARLIGGVNSGGGTIQFTTNAFTVAEDGTNAYITILRLGGTDGQLSVLFSAANGTAVAGPDYVNSSGVITFAPGETIKIIPISVIDNFVTNENKTVLLSLTILSGGATLGDPNTATLTILDNDCVLSFDPASYQVSEADGLAHITVTRTGGALDPVTVQFTTTTNGTAVAGIDYTPTQGTLIFPPGVTSLSFSVPILDDGLVGLNKTVFLTLFDPAGPATLGQTNAVLTIVEKDFAPGIVSFATNNFYALESDGTATITLTRSNGFTGPVSVLFSTANGSGVAGANYGAVSGTITFPDGVTTITVSIPLIDDGVVNGNKTVQLTLSNPRGGAVIGLSTALLTIIEADGAGAFVFDSPTYFVNETNGFATITVLRTGGRTGNATVTALTMGGTATPGVDYLSVSNVLIFTNGQTSATFSVPIRDNNVAEGTLTVTLLLLNPTGGTAIGTPGSATLYIIDREINLNFAAPTFSVNETGGVGVLVVTRIGNTNLPVTVDYATSDGTAHAGLDYISTDGTLTFGPGETNKSIFVRVLHNTQVTGDQYLNVTLSNPKGGATLGSLPAAQLIIHDVEVCLGFASPTYEVTEGFGTVYFFYNGTYYFYGAGTNLTITVVRNGDTNATATVEYVITGGTAIDGLDYLDVNANRSLSFAPGQITNSFSLLILNDGLVDGNETIHLALANPSANATFCSQASAVVTIIDNNSSFGFSQTNYVVNEKVTNAVITVVRRGALTGPASVLFTMTNGTAIAGQDYVSVSQVLNWGANDMTPRNVLVPIINHAIPEGSRSALMSLSNPTGSAFVDLSNGVATLTIAHDAGSIAFSSINYSLQEGITTTNAVITLLRTGGTNGLVTVEVLLSGGTAIPGVDYLAPTSTVVFAYGQTSASFLIPILNDHAIMGNKTLNLRLGNARNGAYIGNPNVALLTIVDSEVNIMAAGSALISDPNGNGVIDPGERVTLLFGLRNAGNVDATNLVVNLLAGNGVTSPTGPMNYGTLVAGGPAVSRQFSFTAVGAKGSPLIATLQFQIGPNTNSVTFAYVLGNGTNSVGNATLITIPDHGPATPYPATITVAGVTGLVSKITVTLVGLTHSSPSDIDMVLVSPSGQTVLLMSGTGNHIPINNITLTFDDAALNSLTSDQITNGVYRPTKVGTANALIPPPAPPYPYGAALTNFNGINPNGVWSLYVVDQVAFDSGIIGGGWKLTISTTAPVGTSCDLSVSVIPTANQIMPNNLLAYTVNVTNHGPSTATDVWVTNTLPADVVYQATSISSGSFSVQDGQVICSLGTLAMDTGAQIIIAVIPTNSGVIAFTSTVVADQSDPYLNNNADTEYVVVGQATAPSLGTVSLGNGQTLLTVNGQLGQTYVIEASGNLRTWTPISTNILRGGSLYIFDADAVNHPQRFYRALRP